MRCHAAVYFRHARRKDDAASAYAYRVPPRFARRARQREAMARRSARRVLITRRVAAKSYAGELCGVCFMRSKEVPLARAMRSAPLTRREARGKNDACALLAAARAAKIRFTMLRAARDAACAAALFARCYE